jgi:hypothetical protein
MLHPELLLLRVLAERASLGALSLSRAPRAYTRRQAFTAVWYIIMHVRMRQTSLRTVLNRHVKLLHLADCDKVADLEKVLGVNLLHHMIILT